jgi:phage gpG-like protein
MISVSTGGLDTVTARLAALPETVAARLEQEVRRLAGVLRGRIERNLSGRVLQRRSGALAASIAVDVARSGLSVAATAGSDSPYAAIHEYGGVIPARTILPKNARALAFPWQGRQRFFKRVQIAAAAMPERSFLRTALAETEPEIRAALEAAARAAMQS